MEGFPDSKLGSKGKKVFLAMKIAHAMTWEYETALYLWKTALHLVKGPQSIVAGSRIGEASTARS